MGIATFFFFQKFSENFPSAPIGIHRCYPESSLGEKNFKISILLGVTRTSDHIVSLCLGECECDTRSCLTSYLTSSFFVKFCGYGCFCVFRL